MFKLIIAFLLGLSIFVLVKEYRKKANNEADLEKIHEELEKTDIDEEIVDAKLKLKERKTAINKKAKKLS